MHVLVCICISLQILLNYILYLFHNFIMFKPHRNICLVLSVHLLYLVLLSLISFWWSFCLFILTKRGLCLFSIDCWHGCFSKIESLLLKFFWLRKKKWEGESLLVAIVTLFSQFELDATWLKFKALNILPIMIFSMYIVRTC